MKIGLVRHFKVDVDYIHGYASAKEFSTWMREYNHIEVIPTFVDLRGIEWNRCYASDLYRARRTAEAIFNGRIMETPLIRELPMVFKPSFEDNIDRQVPFMEWSVYSMLDWAKGGNKVEENIIFSRKRVNTFLDILEEENHEEDNILVVCHGMIMTVLDELLRERGFSGETVVAAKNGEMFLFER